VILSTTAGFVFSKLSRWYFEEPFLRLKERWKKKTESPQAREKTSAADPQETIKA